jgi:hypothetical protein
MPTPPPAPASLAPIYLATIVEVSLSGRQLSAHDAAVALGPFHVLTAWNPGMARPSATDNHAANERLYRDLVSLGLHPHHAVGRDATPGSSHAELSWAVAGLTDDQARALGLAYGQWAVFRIEPGRQTVLGCEEGWVCSRPLGLNA